MALNKIVYFPNPENGQSLGVQHSLATSTTTTATIYTVGAAEVKAVRSFVITSQFLSGGTDDYGRVSLKIGSGYYNYDTSINHVVDTLIDETVSSVSIDMSNIPLQVGDTITFATTLYDNSGTALYKTSLLLVLDDYTA